MNSLTEQEDRKLKSLWEDGNYLPTGSVDCGWLVKPDLSSGSSVESYVVGMTRAQLVLDSAAVMTVTAHCAPDAVVNTLHSSSHLFLKSTTIAWGGHDYFILKSLVTLWLAQGHPVGEMKLGLIIPLVYLQSHVPKLLILYHLDMHERCRVGSCIHKTTLKPGSS